MQRKSIRYARSGDVARAEKVMLTASTDTVGYLMLDSEGTWHTNTHQGGPRKWSEDLGCNLGLIQMVRRSLMLVDGLHSVGRIEGTRHVYGKRCSLERSAPCCQFAGLE